MAMVVITGWVPGFEKVSCTKLVRSRLGLDLRDGKQVTDDILQGTVRRIELASDEEVASLVAELTRTGALAHVEPTARPCKRGE
jgi:ribosomal protein L7/L12